MTGRPRQPKMPPVTSPTARQVAVASRVALAASAPDAPQDRAAMILDAVREVVPFVAAELSSWDVAARRHRTLANAGYPPDVLRWMNGGELLAECAELGIDRTGAPARMRDVPPAARAAAGTISLVLLPMGYREGLTMCLRTADGRPAGLLNLSVDDARHPSDDACALLAALNGTLANVCDATLASRWLRRLAAGDGAEAVALTASGAPVGLAGPVPPALGPGAPALAAAQRAARDLRGGPRRFLARAPTGWLAVTVMPCREAAMPAIVAVVAARPDPDLHGLTPREVEVLTLMADGLSNAQIAARLVVGARTVATHVERVLDKLGAPTRAAAAARAAAEGLRLAPA